MAKRDLISKEEIQEMELEQKWKEDMNFRKKEYQIASSLTMEELEDYNKNYKIKGKSLEQYCNEKNIDWTIR